jgi:gamma-glutamyltranspeptidase/glutathione hydrolase
MLRRSFLFRMPGLSATIGGVTAGTDPARNMASSESRIATQVGLDVLLNGGNAVDTAVAIGLVEAVTLPRAGNLGGGGFMLIRMADGRATSIDYRVQAPGRASRNMFLDQSGKLIPNESLFTHKAACIPGTIAGFSLALGRYGEKR